MSQRCLCIPGIPFVRDTALRHRKHPAFNPMPRGPVNFRKNRPLPVRSLPPPPPVAPRRQATPAPSKRPVIHCLRLPPPRPSSPPQYNGLVTPSMSKSGVQKSPVNRRLPSPSRIPLLSKRSLLSSLPKARLPETADDSCSVFPWPIKYPRTRPTATLLASPSRPASSESTRPQARLPAPATPAAPVTPATPAAPAAPQEASSPCLPTPCQKVRAALSPYKGLSDYLAAHREKVRQWTPLPSRTQARLPAPATPVAPVTPATPAAPQAPQQASSPCLPTPCEKVRAALSPYKGLSDYLAAHREKVRQWTPLPSRTQARLPAATRLHPSRPAASQLSKLEDRRAARQDRTRPWLLQGKKSVAKPTTARPPNPSPPSTPPVTAPQTSACQENNATGGKPVKQVRFGKVTVHKVEYWIDRKRHVDQNALAAPLQGRLQGWRVTPRAEPDEEGETEKYMTMWGHDHSSLYYHDARMPCAIDGCAWNTLARIKRDWCKRGLWDGENESVIKGWNSMRQRKRDRGGFAL